MAKQGTTSKSGGAEKAGNTSEWSAQEPNKPEPKSELTEKDKARIILLGAINALQKAGYQVIAYPVEIEGMNGCAIFLPEMTVSSDGNFVELPK